MIVRYPEPHWFEEGMLKSTCRRCGWPKSMPFHTTLENCNVANSTEQAGVSESTPTEYPSAPADNEQSPSA